MKKFTFFFVSLLIFVMAGCDNSVTHDFPEEYASGEVLVKFDGSVTKAEAKGFIENLSLEPINLSVLETDEYLWTLVDVPEGREKAWVKKFMRYSFVENAELNGIAHAAE